MRHQASENTGKRRAASFRPPVATPAQEAAAVARQAGLRYVSDEMPGIARKPAKNGFCYLDLGGKQIKDKATLSRIKALAIPPAWTEVWISPWDNGHIQATGRDAKRRKQYRYHPRWRAVRDEAKYDRMINFGTGLPREKVVATVVYLLEATMMRIGNEEYARTNKSFGLTTLRDRHANINGGSVEFQFRGKSGVHHKVKVSDPRVARIVRKSRDLPGQELFQYLDEIGERRAVGSGDINDYLREITGEEYTAKDFRTWSGTLLAALALQEFEKFDSQAQAKKNVMRAIAAVAKKLGNTPTICRKCYVHPAVIDAYMDGTMLEALREEARQEMADDIQALSPEEAAVLAFLQERLQKNAVLRRLRRQP